MTRCREGRIVTSGARRYPPARACHSSSGPRKASDGEAPSGNGGGRVFHPVADTNSPPDRRGHSVVLCDGAAGVSVTPAHIRSEVLERKGRHRRARTLAEGRDPSAFHKVSPRW